MNIDFLNKYSDRIQETKKTIKSVWNYENTSHIPALVFFYPNFGFRRDKFVPWDKYLQNKELSLQIKLDAIKEHFDNIDDDYLPYIDSFTGTPLLASAFGGEVKFFSDKDPWIEDRIIKEYKDIDKLKKPDARNSGLLKISLEYIDYWKRETKEKIPISLPDIQGPLSIAIDLMGAQSFYLGLYDVPDKIHNLLQIISELLADYLKIVIGKIKNEDGIFDWTGILFPNGKGCARISEDNLISLSSDMYNEFLKPYNEYILKEISGGIIHWCGNGENNFENVISLKNLTGIHNSNMGDLDLMINQIDRLNNLERKTAKKLVYFNGMLMPVEKKYVEKILSRQKDYKGFFNHIFVPVNDYGLSYNAVDKKGGYEKYKDDHYEVLSEFLRLSKEKIKIETVK
ncbi:MAG: uroporphyrinogen decarboxylase family protein [Candidatus Humimicrobiaceae bacterium]